MSVAKYFEGRDEIGLHTPLRLSVLGVSVV